MTDPDAVTLIEEVQDYYLALYGGHDSAAVAAEQFADEAGLFLVGYRDGIPVASGGWRRLGDRPGLPSPHCAEIKRMYVRPAFRRQGLAAAMLEALEDRARQAGLTHLVLETGDLQTDAVALYRSRGYADIDGSSFSHYHGEEHALALGKALGTAP